MVDATVRDRVLRPAHEVFDAIIDPKKLAGFFISGASAPLRAGENVEWHFADVGMTMAVAVRRIEPDRLIAFDWAASGVTAHVTIALEAQGGDTVVSISEGSWPLDEEGVTRALGQTRGWTDFLCSLKAFVQHGVNLRRGRTRDDH